MDSAAPASLAHDLEVLFNLVSRFVVWALHTGIAWVRTLSLELSHIEHT